MKFWSFSGKLSVNINTALNFLSPHNFSGRRTGERGTFQFDGVCFVSVFVYREQERQKQMILKILEK